MDAPFTYAKGFYLTADKDITKSDMVKLCKNLNEAFESFGITFEPEPITEGGIVYKFKDQPISAYKTIRMRFSTKSIKWCKNFIQYNNIQCYRVSDKHLKKLGIYELYRSHKSLSDWPSIPSNVMELWENNEDVLLEKGLSIGTHLKAFYGAPIFTQSELNTFVECAEKVGFKRDSKMPSTKELESFGKLGRVTA